MMCLNQRKEDENPKRCLKRNVKKKMICLNQRKEDENPKRCLKKECEKEDDVFEQPKRGHKPKCDNTVVTRKRGRPKAISSTEHVTGANVLSEPKRKNVSSALTQRHEADMVNTSEKQK